MTHYIDKDALVAEIKERIETYNKGYANGDDRRADALEVLLNDIDTLKVKEVDLEKESLTWKDIETIGELRLNVALELRRKELESPIKAPLKFTIEDFCKEVLRRFKEMKGK